MARIGAVAVACASSARQQHGWTAMNEYHVDLRNARDME
jgi:hypothetical protein